MSDFIIRFDPDSPELESDLRILVTVKSETADELSYYRDSNGTRQNINRSEFVSKSTQPRVIKQDDISVATNWPKSGGPNVVLLPEGQRVLLGDLPDGVSVDISLWRTFIMAQTFTNRILVRRTSTGVQAFAPKVAPIPEREPSVFSSGLQARSVQSILNSISDDSLVEKTNADPVSEPIAEEVSDPEASVDAPLYRESAEESPEVPETPVVVEEIPSLEPEPEVFETIPEAITSGAIALEKPTEAKKRRIPLVKIMSAVSDVLITFALLAVLYAGYQTVWTGLMSQKSTDKAVAELEVQWKESPEISPVLHKGFALAYIPRLKDKVWGLPITQGVEAEDLHAGLGHYVETPLPGEEGNFAIAGHRSTYGEPLANIDQLQQDDEVIIRTGTNWYTYKLLMTAIVEPDEMWTIDENPGGLVNATGVKEMITITTCDPRWGSTHRWVWWGTLEKVSPIEEVPEAIGTVQ